MSREIWLDNARIIAIFAVIVLHLSSNIFDYSGDKYSYWYIANFFDSLSRWAVPVFMMISGALLVDPKKKESLKQFYKKRIKRVLYPLIFWALFFTMWNFLAKYLRGEHIQSSELIENLLTGKPYYHMWFLYMITTMYIFIPYFRKITRHSTHKEFYVLVVSTLSISVIYNIYEHFYTEESKLFIIWFLLYTPYVFLGYLIKEDRLNILSNSNTMIILFVVTVLATYFGHHYLNWYIESDSKTYFYSNLSITVVPMSVAVLCLLKKINRPIFGKHNVVVSSLTLGIYLVHPVFINIINFFSTTKIFLHPIIYIPLLSVIIFTLSLFVVFVLSKIPFLRRTI